MPRRRSDDRDPRAAGARARVAAGRPRSRRSRSSWTTYERPATYEVVRDSNVPIEMRDGTILRANVDRPAVPGPLADARRPDALQQGRRRQHRARRPVRVLRRARLRGRHRRRPRHRRLVGPVGLVRGERAARRLRHDRVGRGAAVVGRQGRRPRPVLHGDHPAAHRRPAPAAPEGAVPGRPARRRLSRHRLLGRPDQRRVHPLLARPRDRGQRDADAGRGRPARRPSSRCSSTPRAWSTSRSRPSSREAPAASGVRRAVLEDAIAARARRPDRGADVRRRRPPRPLPARRAADLRAAQAQRPGPAADGPLGPPRRLDRRRPPRRRRPGAELDRPALVRPLADGDRRPRSRRSRGSRSGSTDASTTGPRPTGPTRG